MPSYEDIKAKLKSEFDFWCANRDNNFYRLGYSTGYDGMFPKGPKPEMPAATLAYGDLDTLRTWWAGYAGGVIGAWNDPVKEVTQNKSATFDDTQDFVVFTKNARGDRTSGFNFHIRYSPVQPQAPVMPPEPVSKKALNVNAAVFVPAKK